MKGHYNMSGERYSTNQIDAMRNAMPELLHALGINLKSSFNCLTPTHDDHHPSMCFWKQMNKVHCFSCNRTGDTLDVIGWISGETSFPKKVQLLQEITGIDFGDPNGNFRIQNAAKQKQHIGLPVPQKIKGENVFSNVAHACELIFKAQGISAKNYLYSRGFTDKEIKAYFLGWCRHPSDINADWTAFPYNSKGYCVIPFYMPNKNTGGIVRTCTFRPLFASKTKEYKIKGQPSVLYQEHLLYRQADCEVYIVEGAFDAISLETIYGVSACAIGGAGGVNRLLSIVEHTDPQNRVPIVLQLDNDTAGKRMTATLARGLDEIGACYRIAPALPNGVKDANELLQRQRIRDR